MRTFLSQLETARKSRWLEKARSDTVSSGGFETGTSLLRSPRVLLVFDDVEVPLLKRPDIV